MSKIGLLVLTSRKKIKVVIPQKIRIKLKMKHKHAPHQINGLVRLLLRSTRTILSGIGDIDSVSSVRANEEVEEEEWNS